MKKKIENYKRKIICFNFIFISMLLILNSTQSYAAKPEKTRVGFFKFEGYHMMDKEGNRSGYGYEYLQELAKYSDFIYEYVGYDNTWDEMQDMLERGEIDLLTSAQKTEEREGRFAFTDESIGTSSSILTVKAGNTRFMNSEYKDFSGIRVGMLQNNSRNDSFQSFAEEKGFTYVPVYYANTSDLSAALQLGEEIDAIITSNLRKIQMEWVIATFDSSPFYIMVRKENQDLLEKLNSAIDQSQTYNPYLPQELFEKYYSADSGNEIAYTAKERQYINQLAAEGKTISMLVNPDRAPISYFEDGEAKGIIPEITHEIMRRAGIDCEIKNVKTRTEYTNALRQDETVLRLDSEYDYNEAERYHYRLTAPYFESSISCITLDKSYGQPETIAAVKDSELAEKYIKKRYPSDRITYYNSIGECVKAVLEGRQDATYSYTYAAQVIVYKDIKNRLKEVLVHDFSTEFCIAVKQSEDPLLYSILNKAALSMSQEDINEIIRLQTTYSVKDFSLIGYLYDNPAVLTGSVIAVSMILLLLLLYLFQRKNSKWELNRVKEFERFISYVCKVNDSVIEVDLDRMIGYTYIIENGSVRQSVRKLLTIWQFEELLHPEDRDSVLSYMNQKQLEELAGSGKDIYLECRILTNKTEYLWYAVAVQSMQKEEQYSGSLLLFFKNIDAAKREETQKQNALRDALDTARQASAAKGSFMSRMSHEIRTPLNGIIGYLSIARAAEGNLSKIGECMVKSEFAAYHLLNIINDVLDISAIESGQMKIANELFDLKQLLTSTTAIFYTQAREKEVRFDIQLYELTEEKLIGDQLRLNQILMNLLSNAVKFTMKGGKVTLTVSQQSMAGNKVLLLITVSDDGIGMTNEYKQKLFTPFEQQDASTARKFGGTGLGLSITKNLVNLMNGTITVESEEGIGTTFSVGLPFESASPEYNTIKTEYDFSRLYVLVICEDGSDCEYIKNLLDRCGVQSDFVFSIEEAKMKIDMRTSQGHPHGICLLDWNRPEVNGVESALQVRKVCGSDMPIIICAANEYSDIWEELKEAGITRSIVKPLFQSTVLDILADTFGRHSAQKSTKEKHVNTTLWGKRILLAEDNEMNMEIAEEMLKSVGFLIDGAHNGAEALDMFAGSEEGTYQCILMDIQMPVMDGYEATGRIRKSSHPQAMSIPIIALTADAFTEDISHALTAGMNGHVSKPIDFKYLTEVLEQHITGKQ